MQLGKYRHYKWSICEVIGIAKHTETLEEMVIYQHHDEQWIISLRARPINVFQEKIIMQNKEVPRFTYMGE